MKRILFSLLAFLAINTIILNNATAIVDNGDPVQSPQTSPFNSLVEVLYNGYICTGEFIQNPNHPTSTNSNIVLTAGHCAIDFDSGRTLDPSVYTIIAADKKTEYTVSRVITHYDGEYNDFSLLITNASSKNFLKLAPEKVTRNFLVNSTTPPQLLIAGYGINLKTGTTTNSNNSYDLLQGYVTPTRDKYTDQTVDEGSKWIYLQTNGVINLGDSESLFNPNYMFATCPSSKYQSTDHGDSGGPIIYQDGEDGAYYLVGDTSWGLTVSYKNNYYSYRQCIDYNGAKLNDSRLSVFTDLTYNSDSYKQLVQDLKIV